MLQGIRQLYRSSCKPTDNFWNTYVARPVAAVLLVPLRHTRLTPNQITFASLAVALGAAVTLCLWRTHLGLIVGALLLEASYVLDCVDGQLARLTGQTSKVGAHLDFLMDELKAFCYLAAVAVRLWLVEEEVAYLLMGLLGLVVVASAISLTTFMRRPEYLETGRRGSAGPPSKGPPAVPPPGPLSKEPPAVPPPGPLSKEPPAVPPPGPEAALTLAPPGTEALPPAPPRSSQALPLAPLAPRRSLVGTMVRLAEAGGRWVIHYPSYFLYVAVFNFVEGFFFVYIAAHVLYLLRSLAQIVLRLARPPRPPAGPPPIPEDSP